MPRRKRKGNVPVVGAKQLHPVQLSPQVRNLEAKRAKAAAQRTYAPVLAADRQGVQAARRESRRAVGSARGATNAVTTTLAQALGTLGQTGLSGRELQQTKRELTSRIGDAASELPGFLAGLREEGAGDVQKARLELIQDRAERGKAAAGNLNTRLKELRGAGSSAIEAEQGERKKKRQEAQEAGEGKLSKEDKRKVHNAQIALQRFIDDWKKNAPVDGEDPSNGTLQEAVPLKTKADWRKVVEIVKGEEGVDAVAALDAVERLRAKWRKNPRQAIVGTVFNAGS
jgi:hypothetical protein